MQKLVSENRGVLSGIITRVKPLSNMTIVELMDRKGKEEDPEFYSVLFYRKNKDAAAALKKGSRAEFKVHVTSYQKRDEKGKTYNAQSIIADEIVPVRTRLEEAYGFKGRNYAETKNEFYIAGPISGLWRANENSNVINVIVATQNGLRIEPIRLMFFARKPEEFLASHKVGDIICTVCRLQTRRQKKENGYVYYENIVIRDFSGYEEGERDDA